MDGEQLGEWSLDDEERAIDVPRLCVREQRQLQFGGKQQMTLMSDLDVPFQEIVWDVTHIHVEVEVDGIGGTFPLAHAICYADLQRHEIM